MGDEIDVLIVDPSSGTAHTDQFIIAIRLDPSFIDKFIVEQVIKIHNQFCVRLWRIVVAMDTDMRCRCQLYQDLLTV